MTAPRQAGTASAPRTGPGLPVSAARLGRFVLVRCPPAVYVTYGTLFCLAVEGAATALDGLTWRPSWATGARVLTVVLIVFFLRVLDEQKDLEYDRTHHPDRPLVTGAITGGELRAAMAVTALTVPLLNVPLGWASAVAAVLPLGYGLFLAALERRAPTLEEHLVTTLLVALPAQLLVIGYVYLSVTRTGDAGADWRAVPLALAVVAVVLHFELARKTTWQPPPGARSYARALGPVGGAALTLALAGVATAVIVLLFRRPAPVLGVLPPLLVAVAAAGGWRFLRAGHGDWPLLPALVFVTGSFLTLFAQAVVT